MNDSDPAYEVYEVSKTFRGAERPANDRISFTIERGEFFGLLGSNGAGKTTLVKQMVGLLNSDSGSIRLFGHDVLTNSVFTSMQVGYMPQTAFALNSLTVAEAIYFSAHLRGLSSRGAKRQRDTLIEQLQLGPLRNKVSRQISGGERRLLQLAVSIVADPPVLILDEPTNELDPVRRRQVWSLLHDLNRKHGRTIVLITHNALEAEQVIEQVGILREGRMVAVGTPGVLKSRGTLRLDITLREESGWRPPNYVIVESQYRDKITAHVASSDLARLTSDIDPNSFLEFRLQSTTLEDVYLNYVQ